jgi:CheY-like chemotaxis protein
VTAKSGTTKSGAIEGTPFHPPPSSFILHPFRLLASIADLGFRYNRVPPPLDAALQPDARLSLRVLLVDDHEDTNRSLTLLLGRRGYKVKSAFSMTTAVNLASREEFDVLVSDIALPDGSGLDLLRQLAHPLAIGGIVLSGYGMDEDVQRSKAAGFKAHLSKPVDFNKLDALIQRLAREERMKDEG